MMTSEIIVVTTAAAAAAVVIVVDANVDAALATLPQIRGQQQR
jgi:hypothetical protein